MKPIILILIVALIGCSRSTTPKRIDCPAPTIGNDGSVSNESEIRFAPVDTMPVKRDHCPHDVVLSTLAHCTPPGAKCNVCECIKCGATWPCN